MNRGSMNLVPSLTLVAAFAFGIAGMAASQRAMSEGFLGACILLAAISLVVHLRASSGPSFERLERRRRR